jgi:hypothetical protein
VREAGLAESGGADDGDQAAAPLGHRPLQRPLQLGQGVLPPDERRLQPGHSLRTHAEGEQPVGGDRVVLAPEHERVEVLGLDRPRTSAKVDSASRISPGSAACCSRAALFAVSPATKFRSGTRPLPATVPVLIPVRIASTTP